MFANRFHRLPHYTIGAIVIVFLYIVIAQVIPRLAFHYYSVKDKAFLYFICLDFYCLFTCCMLVNVCKYLSLFLQVYVGQILIVIMA